MGNQAMSTGEAQRAFQNLETMAQDFRKSADGLLEALNRVADAFGSLLGNLRQLIDELWQAIQMALEAIKTCIEEVFGWPWDLWNAGDRWTAQVGAVASSLVGTVDAAQMSADDHWQGIAHDAYTQAIPQQTKALAAIKAACDDIDDAMTAIGWGQVAFAVTLTAAVALAIAQYCVAGAATATVVGAPPAAAFAGLTTAQLVTAVAAIVAAFVTTATLVSKSCTDLQQRLDNNDAFIGVAGAATWPRATGDIHQSGEWKARA
jgi:hypothetical protein